MPARVRRYIRPAVVCLTVLLSATATAAEDQPRSHPGSTRDFLFGQPRGSIAVRGSWLLPRGGSDLYDFVTDQLTLEKSDFRAPAIAFEVGVAAGSRLEVLGGVEYSQSRSPSEYRRFIDTNNLPITQETQLKEVHVSGSVRLALLPPGQSISRLAWVPRGFIPYVGGGAGALYYDFLQSGDFVDFVDLSVFPDAFQSKGWAPSAHVFGGADVQIWRLLFLQVEGRYVWAEGELHSDFIDFEPIDLAGFRMTAGIRYLF